MVKVKAVVAIREEERRVRVRVMMEALMNEGMWKKASAASIMKMMK